MARVDQRRLARAVRADEPEHLAGSHGDRHAVERIDDAEAHPHPLRLEGLRTDRRTSRGLEPSRALHPEAELGDQAREAVRDNQQHAEHDDAEGELDGLRAVEEIAERVRHDRAGSERGADERADDIADATDDRVQHDEDRLEHRERRIEDDARPPEADEHAAHARDRGAEPERIQLRPDDADAERRRSPLVRADGDEPATSAAAPQVRDREREDDEADEREHRVPLRMRRGVEVEPEERDRADLRSGDAASASRVVEDQAFDDEREAQGRDGEVHSSRSQRG